MRTLDECYNELKALDPNTAVSKYFIRQLAISGKIPCIRAGRKRLINFDKLLDYLNGKSQPPSSGIRAFKS
jgi:excisionase family DNA binding protein